MKRISAQEIISKLHLQPHPKEGGFFIETYRSTESLSAGHLDKRYQGDRSVATAIYYLLTPDTFSTMHRLMSDEIFHFYLGDPVTMLNLYPDGSSKVHTLGSDLMSGHQCQIIVHKNVWQGACLNPDGEFALLGTTVAPGFDFIDYEEGLFPDLIQQYPTQTDLIKKLTKKST